MWDVLTNPEVLRSTLPGCQKFESMGDGHYSVVMVVGIGPVKGTYTGKVTLAEAEPPASYTLEVEARGAVGFMTGKGHFTLAPVDGDPSRTQVHYAGEAHVGGPVAGVGQRLVRAGAGLIVGQFFRSMDKKVADSQGSGARD